MLRGLAPVAMTMLRVLTRVISPSGPVTSMARAGNDAGVALDVIHIVLAEQETYAAGHAIDDLAAAFHGHRVVGMEIVERQAELVGALDVGDDFGVFEEGLGGDATPVEANSTEGFSFDNAGFEAQLTGSDGGHIATRPASDYCYVIP